LIFFTLASLLFDGVFNRPGAGYAPKNHRDRIPLRCLPDCTGSALPVLSEVELASPQQSPGACASPEVEMLSPEECLTRWL
jgi:hypothetical protein